MAKLIQHCCLLYGFCDIVWVLPCHCQFDVGIVVPRSETEKSEKMVLKILKEKYQREYWKRVVGLLKIIERSNRVPIPRVRYREKWKNGAENIKRKILKGILKRGVGLLKIIERSNRVPLPIPRVRDREKWKNGAENIKRIILKGILKTRCWVVENNRA